MRYCQLPARTENKTFETFKERTADCKAAKEMAYRLAQGDEDIVFLTMLSDTGLGKTHLSIAICREWLKRGEPAKYCYVPELLDDIRDSYRKDETTGLSHSQLLDVLGTVGLLVLDDLGTEKKSDWACETLQTIVDRRARSVLPLVVTANKALDELPNDDEGRIASRLQREIWCKVMVF
ncbi:DNA replication protein DnaC [subsurface metagenome]